MDENDEEEIKKNPNRFAMIHVLFRRIAEERMKNDGTFSNAEKWDINRKAQDVKAYWKGFFGVDSLTELNNRQLERMVTLMKARLKSLNYGRSEKENDASATAEGS